MREFIHQYQGKTVAEDRDVTPVTPFGLHNLFAEQLLALASNQGLLEGISLRLANVYGPSPCGGASDAQSVLNKMARFAVRGVRIQPSDSGQCPAVLYARGGRLDARERDVEASGHVA